MLIQSIPLIIVGLLNILIGLVVLTRDTSKTQNRIFFLFSLSLGGWVIGIAGFLMTNEPRAALVWAKVYYSFPLLIAATMPLFARSFPLNSRIPRSWWIPILAGYIALALPLIFDSTFITRGLVYQEWGKEILLDKISYVGYSIFLLTCFGVGLVHTFIKSRRTAGLTKLQTQFFFTGFLLTSFFGVLFNLVYPFFGNYRLIWLGPLFTNAFIIATGYSIIRHRMFDIKLIIARSFAYILSLSVLAIGYGFLFFGVTTYVFNLHVTLLIQILISIATAVAALTFPTLKKFFDRQTNNLFYRDAYDAQILLDKMNKILVSNTNLESLLQNVAVLLQDEMKLSYVMFCLKTDDDPNGRLIGRGNHSTLSAKDFYFMRHVTPQMGSQIVISADSLPEERDDLKDILFKNNISVLARLTSGKAIREHKDGLGYMVMGVKRSGNPYNRQDLNLLDIVTNELAIAIQNALRFEEIQKFSQTLQKSIADATNKLRKSNEKLMALDETKDDFISMASHQMRTPLTSIKGYLSMVLEEDAGKITPMQREMLGQAFFSSQRMVYLIADLLNVSRLKTGKFLIEASPVNLADMVEQELKQLEESAASRSLTLRYDKPDSFPAIMLDETKTRQVIMNFVDNSIYYTPAGGHIEVKLIDRPSSIELRVEDDGIGVAKDEQHHLFTKFYRAGNARKARPDGTGLGLYMAKKVIAGQNGSIIFESEEGKGSTFGFVFGKARLEPTPSDGEVRKEPAAMAVRAHLTHYDQKPVAKPKI